MNPTPIKYSYWVIPGKFLAGEYPRQLEKEASKEKIDALIQAGVTAFIDLTEARDGLEPYTPFLDRYASKGVTHQQFPIRDVSVPASPGQTNPRRSNYWQRAKIRGNGNLVPGRAFSVAHTR